MPTPTLRLRALALRIALLVALLCAASAAAAGYFFVWVPGHSAGQLAPFTTDGCSDFPNGTPLQKNLWLHCCIAHDKTYWAGGTAEERVWADHELEACVAGVGEPAVARVMLAGVRVGGSPWWPTSYRWGYGWPYSHGYRPLTAQERDEARHLLAYYERERPAALSINAPASAPMKTQ